ncbi:uncharacterized protein LOC142765847 [Rhipicephalus microplus]|uniref:uncharacterized protein LOC142765847 n=1 Tax=Rhipicephalus microplus TaxID=6941 RepID=UPI003F6B9AA9
MSKNKKMSRSTRTSRSTSKSNSSPASKVDTSSSLGDQQAPRRISREPLAAESELSRPNYVLVSTVDKFKILNSKEKTLAIIGLIAGVIVFAIALGSFIHHIIEGRDQTFGIPKRPASPEHIDRETWTFGTDGPAITAVFARSPRETILCTVSVHFSESSLLPEDDLCHIIFYESFYVKNSPSAWNDAGLDHFFDLMSRMNLTSTGASFSLADGQLFAEDRSNVLYGGIDNLRSLGVQHFGLLKVYEDYVTDSSKFAQCLKILKRIVTHIQRAARQDGGCPPVVYTVLGVRLTQDIHRLKVGKFNTVFRPTFFIAITHLSVPYTDTAESLVYPMSMISTPGNITRNSAQKNAYPDLSSINKAVDDLDWMRNNSKSDMSFYISLSMRARYYTLDAASGVTFDLFGPSKKSTNGEYKEDIDPKHVCCEEYGYYYRYNSTVGAEYTFSPQENRTLVFDSERGVNEKFCAALDRRKNLKVSVAVYDIDFDQADVACPNLYMGRGPFRRVKVLKVLSRQHPLDIYWIESKALKVCRTIRYTEVRDPCCPGS